MKPGWGIALVGIAALTIGVCVACDDDDDEESSWVPQTEDSETPPGCGPGRQDEPGGCDDKGLIQLPLDNNDGGNEHRDCENNQSQCSDDDFSPSFEDSPVRDSFNPTICLPLSRCEIDGEPQPST